MPGTGAILYKAGMLSTYITSLAAQQVSSRPCFNQSFTRHQDYKHPSYPNGVQIFPSSSLQGVKRDKDSTCSFKTSVYHGKSRNACRIGIHFGYVDRNVMAEDS
jgi:hypothetical protein